MGERLAKCIKVLFTNRELEPLQNCHQKSRMCSSRLKDLIGVQHLSDFDAQQCLLVTSRTVTQRVSRSITCKLCVVRALVGVKAGGRGSEKVRYC